MRIVFLGTPEFAVSSLDILVTNGYDICGVVTVPDKPAGRGQQVQQSAVKKYAESKGLKVLQPSNLKDAAWLEELRSLHADLFIVVAFRMLPEAVWQMPPFGTFNLHASLLPDYRGAAPINWAIMNGEKETGVTTFFLQHEIDTGAIIYNEKVKIEETDTAGRLHDKLKETGAALVLKTVQTIESGSCPRTPQETIAGAQIVGAQRHTAPKLNKQLCRINWHKYADEVYNLIRGLSPYPAAWSEIKTSETTTISVKIFTSSKDHISPLGKAGRIFTDRKTFLKVHVPDGCIDILELQPAGKNKMSIKDFLNGYKPEEDWIFV